MGLFEDMTDENRLLISKGAFVLWMFLMTLLFALLPMIIMKNYRRESDPDRRTRYSRLIGLLNCFAGGVFLGTAMLHLLPNVTAMLQEAENQTHFPLAEFMVSFGFLLVLVIEQTGMACKEQEVDTLNPIQRLSQRGLPVFDSEIRSLRADEVQQQSSRCSSNLPETVEVKPTSHLRSVLLLAVLSIHSVFEGLAIGLQSDINSILNIFIAVMLHKSIVSFSVGLNMLQSRLHLASVVALDILFALMSPLGLLLGMFVETYQTGAHQQLFSGTLQGIACGTFIYITCFEVLPREFHLGRDRLMKLFNLLIGFSATVGVIFIEGS